MTKSQEFFRWHYSWYSVCSTGTCSNTVNGIYSLQNYEDGIKTLNINQCFTVLGG